MLLKDTLQTTIDEATAKQSENAMITMIDDFVQNAQTT